MSEASLFLLFDSYSAFLKLCFCALFLVFGISRGKDCFSKDVVYGRFCSPTLQLLLVNQCWAFSIKRLKLIYGTSNRWRSCWSKINIISHDLAFLEGNKKTKSVTNIDFMKLDVGHISSSEGF